MTYIFEIKRKGEKHRIKADYFEATLEKGVAFFVNKMCVALFSNDGVDYVKVIQ